MPARQARRKTGIRRGLPARRKSHIDHFQTLMVLQTGAQIAEGRRSPAPGETGAATMKCLGHTYRRPLHANAWNVERSGFHSFELPAASSAAAAAASIASAIAAV